jgi:hypothetical protein
MSEAEAIDPILHAGSHFDPSLGSKEPGGAAAC